MSQVDLEDQVDPEDFFGQDENDFENKALRMRREDPGVIVNLNFRSRKDLMEFADALDTPAIKQAPWAKVMPVTFIGISSKRNPFGF